mgnify:CR=1 FL=1
MAKGRDWKRSATVDGGRRKEWRSRLVNVPVHRGSTILFDTVEELEAARPGLGKHSYGLQGTETHWALSEALTALEPGAAGTVLYPSGLAAITTAILALVEAGDELLVTDSVYGPTRKFCDTILRRLGVAARYVDPLVEGAAIAALFTDRTRAILLESPGSNTMEVQDVPGIAAAARARGIATILDNTWATPLLFEAIAAGVDISVIAATKFVGGHSDVMIGAATTTAELLPRMQATTWDLGLAVSPDDAWLASRGLRTMALRMAEHEASALAVARWLAAQPRVGRVLHPALPDCPGHERWARDFKGSSSLFSFELKGSRAERAAFINSLEKFGIGWSWGGFESLAVPADGKRTVSTPPAPNLVRLQIGLEEPAELIADLDRALNLLR